MSVGRADSVLLAFMQKKLKKGRPCLDFLTNQNTSSAVAVMISLSDQWRDIPQYQLGNALWEFTPATKLRMTEDQLLN